MRTNIVIVLALLLGVGAPANGIAETALPPSVDAFVASSAALAKSGNDLVDLGRSTDRLDRIRAALTEQIEQAALGAVVNLKDLDEVILLCTPRGNAIVASAERNYIQAVAAKINEVGTPSQIDNLSAAIGALFASQSVDVSGLPDDATLKKEQKNILDRCSSDLKSYDEAYYGKSLSFGNQAAALGGAAIPSLALLGSVGSLVDTIVSIITPAVVEGSKLVDESKRREVVLAFLRNSDNRQNIENAGRDLAARISKFVLYRRHRLAAAFEEQAALLRSKEIELSKLPECKAYLGDELNKRASRRSSGSPNDSFTTCWKAAWDQLNVLAASVAKAGNDYDQLADAGDSDNATKTFDPLSKSLNGMVQANGNLDEVSASRIWNWTTKLLAFADKITKSASSDNQKKIKEAIDGLAKGS